MQNLIAFLTRYYYWLLFILLEAVSITLLFSYNHYQGSVWFSTANTVAGKCYELESAVTSYITLKQANEALTQENARLQLALANAREHLADLECDTMGLRREIAPDCKVINAKVVQNSINKADNLITIDKGTADGVRPDMGVVSGSGVVGIVYLAGKHYSVVIPILNQQSNISCRIRNRGYCGFIRWQGNDPLCAYAEDVPRHAHYKKGDVVETSGYSSVFPPGITIGKVLCTFNSPDGLSYRVKIKLATDFASLRDVAVIDNSQMQERLDIMRTARDSIAKR